MRPSVPTSFYPMVLLMMLLGSWIPLGAGCGGSKQANEEATARSDGPPAGDSAVSLGLNVVSTVGAIQSILHENLTFGLVSLADLLPDPRLYGLGALSGLRGEITIMAGRAYIAIPVGKDSSRTIVEERSKELATLLVYARVAAWGKVTLREEIGPEDLDRHIRALAVERGLDPGEPFPFLVEGRVRKLSFHVIDGTRLEGGAKTHEDHLAAAVRHELEETEARLIGFYSERHHGIFTHMDSNTHLHCVLSSPRVSGHVDRVTLPAGTALFFPE